MTGLTHLDGEGRARMVDVGDKPVTTRQAEARGELRCLPETLAAVRAGTTPKGSVIATAELAGVMAAKRTADLIPLCHPLALTRVAVDLEPVVDKNAVRCQATVETRGCTGVEMEALTAVSVACLTIYDMVKAVERGIQIEGIRLVEKKGGKSGHYLAEY